jgi:hypothetical protein
VADVDLELRQFRQMDQRLNEFARGELPIDKTIKDLKALFWVLENSTPQGEWGRQFLGQWGELEIAYALSLDARDPLLPDATQPNLRRAVDQMTELVKGRIASLNSN